MNWQGDVKYCSQLEDVDYRQCRKHRDILLEFINNVAASVTPASFPVQEAAIDELTSKLLLR